MKKITVLAFIVISMLSFVGCSVEEEPRKFMFSDNSIKDTPIERIDITEGDVYKAVNSICASSQVVEIRNSNNNDISLEITLSTEEDTLLENTKAFVTMADKIRTNCASVFLEQDYSRLLFSHTIVGDEKNNYMLFAFDKKGEDYIVSDDNESAKLSASLYPEYAKAFSSALDELK